MKVIRKQKKNKKQKQKILGTKELYNPWQGRSKQYSEYPYIVTVSFFRKNVFLSASDITGKIKLWINAGRLGFKGADKIQYIAVIAVAEKFFKRLVRYGIRHVFLKFKNYKRPRAAIKKAIKKLRLTKVKKFPATRKTVWKKLKGRYRKITQWVRGKRIPSKLHFLGIWTELHVSFNGCRKKKQRRKRHRRRARVIRLR